MAKDPMTIDELLASSAPEDEQLLELMFLTGGDPDFQDHEPFNFGEHRSEKSFLILPTETNQ
jgi:hypothetical protein